MKTTTPQIKTNKPTKTSLSDKILEIAHKHEIYHSEDNVAGDIETITLLYNRWEQGILLYNDLTDLLGRGGGRVRQDVKQQTITVSLNNGG